MRDDEAAITRLIFAYAERIDAGDFAGVADLLADATLRSDRRPSGLQGREPVLRLYESTVLLHEDGTPCTKHVTTNVVVEVDAGGLEAAARSYFTVLQARPGLPLQPIIAGRYRDRFAKVAGAWRFSERLIVVDLVGDLRHHLKVEPPRPASPR
ncbi:MAG: nuclear transport factor 2 family protein [Thermodesulfobacteriota bacterium]